jgi:hypothetical protein
MGEVTRPRRRARGAALALAAALVAAADGAAASLVRNGAFTEGAGGTPAGWRTEAWNADAAEFAWEVAPDGTGTIAITNPTPNDARWCQTIAVEPGATYRIAGRVRTREVGAGAAGAFIAIEPLVGHTPIVHGTADWRPLQVLLEARANERRWDVCPRLGSYGSLNTGTAWFTDVEVVLVRAAPAAAAWRVGHLWDALRQTGWFPIALPIAAGVLLAFGLGILRRRGARES